jgi:hypothetical protein
VTDRTGVDVDVDRGSQSSNCMWANRLGHALVGEGHANAARKPCRTNQPRPLRTVRPAAATMEPANRDVSELMTGRFQYDIQAGSDEEWREPYQASTRQGTAERRMEA